jgi:hypothetical protein
MKMIYLLRYPQKVNSSLTLFVTMPYIIRPTSAHYIGIVSSHILTNTIIKHFGREKETTGHIHITFIIAYYYNCSILLSITVNLLLCLIYKLNPTIVFMYI